MPQIEDCLRGREQLIAFLGSKMIIMRVLVLYTLGTALIGHHYRTMKGAKKIDSMDGFYKYLSIMGGVFVALHHRCGKILDQRHIGIVRIVYRGKV